MMGRIVCLDYGRARIGLATTDAMKIIVSPVGVIKAGKNVKESAMLTIKRLEEWSDIERIILGLPLHMSGKESEMSKEVREFATELESLTQIPIQLMDERLTSAGAEKLMSSHGVSRKKRSEQSDAMAAAELLRSYINMV